MLVFDGYGMSKDEGLESIICKAGEFERNYDWLGAAEFYRKALALVSETDFLKKGRVQERVGYALYRAGMQAESVDEFKERMHRAVAGYQKAREFYGRASGPGKKPRTIRCEAMIAYVGYWLASKVPEKKRLLDECWQQTSEALKAFESSGEGVEYGKTYKSTFIGVQFPVCP